MPLFDYFCADCGFVLEDCLIWTKEDEYVPCPKCGTVMVKKIPASNFVIKGGTPRFYERGNKKKEK